MSTNELTSPNNMPLVIGPEYMTQLRAYYCRMELLHAANDNMTGKYATELTRAVQLRAFASWMLNQDNQSISDMVLEDMCGLGEIDVANALEKYFSDIQQYYAQRYATTTLGR